MQVDLQHSLVKFLFRVIGSRSRSQEQNKVSVCHKPLQSEAGETGHLLSNVVYVMIHWDGGGEPRVTDLRWQA